MSDPIKDLREALGEIREENEGFNRAQIVRGALARAEAALTELEAQPRYTVGQVFEAVDTWFYKTGNILLNIDERRIIRRFLAAAKSTTAEEER